MGGLEAFHISFGGACLSEVWEALYYYYYYYSINHYNRDDSFFKPVYAGFWRHCWIFLFFESEGERQKPKPSLSEMCFPEAALVHHLHRAACQVTEKSLRKILMASVKFSVCICASNSIKAGEFDVCECCPITW